MDIKRYLSKASQGDNYIWLISLCLFACFGIGWLTFMFLCVVVNDASVIFGEPNRFVAIGELVTCIIILVYCLISLIKLFVKWNKNE